MHERKAAMAQEAEAFIALPGITWITLLIVLKEINDCVLLLYVNSTQENRSFVLRKFTFIFGVLDCSIECIMLTVTFFSYPPFYPHNQEDMELWKSFWRW